MTREGAIQKRDIIVTQIINELGVTIETNTKPLIRCRECKFWCCKDNKGLDGVCFKGTSISQMRRPDFSIGRWRTADDFCSYGERNADGKE